MFFFPVNIKSVREPLFLANVHGYKFAFTGTFLSEFTGKKMRSRALFWTFSRALFGGSRALFGCSRALFWFTGTSFSVHGHFFSVHGHISGICSRGVAKCSRAFFSYCSRALFQCSRGKKKHCPAGGGAWHEKKN